MSGKPYYPNNWEAYKDAPDDAFESHTFEEIMSWKVAGWELPSSVCCIIRAENKVKSLMAEGAEFTVCTDSAIHFISPDSTDVIDYD